MALTADFNQAFLPESVGPLIVQPLREESVALEQTTIISAGVHTRATRFPIVTGDVSAAWTPEGEEIAHTDGAVDELEVVPIKVAALSIISRELAEDSTPGAADIVGRGMVASLARKIDAAFFAATTANGPAGIASIAHQSVDTGAFGNLDPFAEALSKARSVGATTTAFIAAPATVLALHQLKDETGSNRPLLTPDPTRPGQSVIFGVPLIVSPDIAAGVVWAVPRAHSFSVLREDTTLAVDSSAFFTSDRVAVRATCRVAFGFPHPAAVVRIGPSGS